MKKLLSIITFSLIGLSPLLGLAHIGDTNDEYSTWEYMMGGGDGHMMGGFGLLGMGWIFMVLFWGLIITGIVIFIIWIVKQSQRSAKGENKTALDILEERYAKGEIDKQEYKEKKKELS